MSEPVGLKKFAILANILAELKAIPEEQEEREIHEVMLRSVEEEFSDEMKGLTHLLKDKNLRKAFVEMVLSEFLGRVKLYTSRVSCANCENLVDCRFKRMVKEGRFLPAWHEELERDAILCDNYVPQEELISGREFKNRAKHIFEIFKLLGLELDDRVKRNVTQIIERSVLFLIQKTKEKNKIVVS